MKIIPTRPPVICTGSRNLSVPEREDTRVVPNQFRPAQGSRSCWLSRHQPGWGRAGGQERPVPSGPAGRGRALSPAHLPGAGPRSREASRGLFPSRDSVWRGWALIPPGRAVSVPLILPIKETGLRVFSLPGVQLHESLQGRHHLLSRRGGCVWRLVYFLLIFSEPRPLTPGRQACRSLGGSLGRFEVLMVRPVGCL